MPVILADSNYRHWLNPGTDLSHITQLFKQYPAKYMNAYPISATIKSPKNNSKELMNPLGDRIAPEFVAKVTRTITKSGFGHKKKNQGQQNPTMGERNS
jgi:hypothetical protein